MGFVLAIAETRCPPPGARPYMHVFLGMAQATSLAFGEVQTRRPWGMMQATPEWVQHIAFKVDSVDG